MQPATRPQNPMRLPGAVISPAGASMVLTYSWLLRAGLMRTRRDSGSSSEA